MDDHGVKLVGVSLLRRLEIPDHRLGALSRGGDKLVDHLLLVRGNGFKLAKAGDLAVVVINDVTASLLFLQLFSQVALVELKREGKVHVVIQLLFVGVESFHLYNQDARD